MRSRCVVIAGDFAKSAIAEPPAIVSATAVARAAADRVVVCPVYAGGRSGLLSMRLPAAPGPARAFLPPGATPRFHRHDEQAVAPRCGQRDDGRFASDEGGATHDAAQRSGTRATRRTAERAWRTGCVPVFFFQAEDGIRDHGLPPACGWRHVPGLGAE